MKAVRDARTASSCDASPLRPINAAIGIDGGAFQNWSNAADTEATPGPNVSTSRSPNATSPASKYSSPMLRPPRIGRLVVGDEGLVVHARFRREEVAEHSEAAECARADRMKSRISTLGWASSASSVSSFARLPTSSMSTRNAHAAVGRAQQRVGEMAPGEVVMPDVVLARRGCVPRRRQGRCGRASASTPLGSGRKALCPAWPSRIDRRACASRVASVSPSAWDSCRVTLRRKACATGEQQGRDGKRVAGRPCPLVRLYPGRLHDAAHFSDLGPDDVAELFGRPALDLDPRRPGASRARLPS